MPEPGNAIIQQRLEKVERLRSRHIDPYPARYKPSHNTQEAVALFEEVEKRSDPESRTEELSVAGRLLTMRNMGKASFASIKDGSGGLQLHLRRDVLGEGYDFIKELDLGDFVGAKGPLFRTRTGEITLEVHELTLLAKSLRSLPEKWHGLKDVEKRYRQRYLDLISNEEARRIFLVRSRVVDSMRRFLNERGFMEVETPVLVAVPAGAMAHPFETHHTALNRRLYLRTATELYLKRLIVGGMDRVYEIGRIFRNEGIDADHNPEFTMLESYQAYADYNDVMSMVEEMVFTIAGEVCGGPKIMTGEHEIDLTPPWRRVTLREEIYNQCGLDFMDYPDVESLVARMRSLEVQVDQNASWGRLLDKLISAKVEPHLVQPTFLVDYPVEMSPLAKKKSEDPRLVERFEGFATGMELANAFSELNDPVDQRQRMQSQEALRLQYESEEVDRLDEDFLIALEHGMPPTGGLGLGIDRLVMLLTGQRTIREVILFPHMRTTTEEVVERTQPVHKEEELSTELEESLVTAIGMLEGDSAVEQGDENVRVVTRSQWAERIATVLEGGLPPTARETLQAVHAILQSEKDLTQREQGRLRSLLPLLISVLES